MRCVSTPGSWPGRRVIEDAQAPGETEEELAFKAIECLAASSGTGPRDRLGPESGPYRRPTCRASWVELTRHRPPYLGDGRYTPETGNRPVSGVGEPPLRRRDRTLAGAAQTD